MDVARKTIVREHHWEPEALGSLFFDREDYNGMLFWYDDVLAMNKEIKKKIKDKEEGEEK